MKTVMNRKLFALLVLVATFVLPVAAFAQDDPDSTGAMVSLGIIGLVLAIIAVVAVIGAVSLGIIGIGWALSEGE